MKQDRDDVKEEAKPLRERYDWPSIAIFLIMLGTFVYALMQR